MKSFAPALAICVLGSFVALGTTALAADPTCEFHEIDASTDKAPAMDAKIPPVLAKKLAGGPFKQWNAFKVQAQVSKTLAKKKPEKMALKQGSISAELLAIVDRSKTQLRVILDEGGKTVADQQITIEAGDWQIVTVDRGGKGHLVAATCK
jgi:hypothetical protein